MHEYFYLSTTFLRVRRSFAMANFDLRRDSGRDSVGKAVASNARGLRFESSHRQTFISDIYLFEKTKIKKKRPGM